MDYLKGKRTYIAAAGLLLVAFAQYSAGDLLSAGQSVMAALAAFGLRQAIDGLPRPPQQPPQNPPTTPVV